MRDTRRESETVEGELVEGDSKVSRKRRRRSSESCELISAGLGAASAMLSYRSEMAESKLPQASARRFEVQFATKLGSLSSSSIFCLINRVHTSRTYSTWRDTRSAARGARQPTRKQRWRVASHLRSPAFKLDEEGSVAHWQPLVAVRRILTSSRHDGLRLLSSYHSLLPQRSTTGSPACFSSRPHFELTG